MASRGQSLTVVYTAWDTAANAPKTGDSANHTLRWIKDGSSAEPTNSPSQVDATNAPGEYSLVLTTSECTAWLGKLCGKSSTANVVILPISINFENVPTATPGATSGLPLNKSSTVGGAIVLENVILHSSGLDGISTTGPTGPATNYREMVVQVWRRFFKKHAKDNTAKTIKLYADDGTTQVTSQSYTDDGNGNETVDAAT